MLKSRIKCKENNEGNNKGNRNNKGNNKINNKVNNKGNITVEACLVMPIVLGVVVLAISLFLNLYIDAGISSNSYVKLYTYYEPQLDADQASIDLGDRLTANYTDLNVVTVDAEAKKGVISLKLNSSDKNDRGMYVYAGNDYKYNIEYNRCTPRLRRWQAFGDVICE